MQEPEEDPNMEFACVTCGEWYPNKRKLKRHHRRSPHCEASAEAQRRAAAAEESWTAIQPAFPCGRHCARFYPTIEKLIVHRMLSLKEDNPYICGRCEELFDNYGDFTAHVRIPITAYHIIDGEGNFKYIEEFHKLVPLLCKAVSKSQPTRDLTIRPAESECLHKCIGALDATSQIMIWEDFMPDPNQAKCNIYIEAGDWTFKQRAFVFYWLILKHKQAGDVVKFLKQIHRVNRNSSYAKEMMAEQLSRGMFPVFNAYVKSADPKPYAAFKAGDWDKFFPKKRKAGDASRMEGATDDNEAEADELEGEAAEEEEPEEEGPEPEEAEGETEGEEDAADVDEGVEGAEEVDQATEGQGREVGPSGTEEDPFVLEDEEGGEGTTETAAEIDGAAEVQGGGAAGRGTKGNPIELDEESENEDDKDEGGDGGGDEGADEGADNEDDEDDEDEELDWEDVL